MKLPIAFLQQHAGDIFTNGIVHPADHAAPKKGFSAGQSID